MVQVDRPIQTITVIKSMSGSEKQRENSVRSTRAQYTANGV